MRLINADAFKETLGKDTKIREMFCRIIDEQPTAYDVEKVVAELENFSLDTTPHCNEMMREGLCDGISDCDYCKIQYAIDIVRRSCAE